MAINPRIQAPVKIHRDGDRFPGVQRLPYGLLAMGKLAAGRAGFQMTFDLRTRLRLQLAGSVVQQISRAFSRLHWAIHSVSLFFPKPYGPSGRAVFHTPETAAILSQIRNNSALWRSANTPFLRIYASARQPAASPATWQPPAGLRPGGPDTPSSVPPSAADPTPAGPVFPRNRRPDGPPAG